MKDVHLIEVCFTVNIGRKVGYGATCCPFNEGCPLNKVYALLNRGITARMAISFSCI